MPRANPPPRSGGGGPCGAWWRGRPRAAAAPSTAFGGPPPPLRGGGSARGAAATPSSTPRQLEDVLGDDAEHDLGGAALDGVALGAQPLAGERAAVRALALPLERLRATGGHHQLVAALVELGAEVFEHRRLRPDPLAGLGLVLHALERERKGPGVDLGARDVGAQEGVGEAAFGVGADHLRRDLAERPGAE